MEVTNAEGCLEREATKESEESHRSDILHHIE